MPNVDYKNYRIVIPSKNNSDRVLSFDLFDSVSLVVPKNQASDYARNYGKKNVTALPEDIDTKAKVRNWIRLTFEEEWIFMIDDNVDIMMRMYPPKKGRDRTVDDSELITAIIENTIMSASQYGSLLFGFSESTTYSHYDVFNPISTFGFISTKAFGIHKDMDFEFKGEYLQGHWMTGINAYKYRKVYIDNRFSFRKLRGTLSQAPQEEWRKLDDAFGKKLFKKKHSCENDILNKVI